MTYPGSKIYYSNIFTKDILNEEYLCKHKTIYEIASEYGCSLETVHNYLVLHNIKIRNRSDVQKLRYAKYVPSNDIVFEEYFEKKQSMQNIADKYGCNITTIFNILNNASMQRRNYQDSQRLRRFKSIPIRDEFSCVLDGLLLGDGGLFNQNGFQVGYTQCSNQKEFIDYVSDIFKENNYFSISNYIKPYNKITNKYYDRYYFYSKITIELSVVYNRWYPDGKKHVPKDIVLTPITVLLWYLGDGYKRKNYRGSGLCTNSFSLDEHKILTAAFEKIGIQVIIQKKGNYHALYIKSKMFDNFFNYIKQSPVSCYNYKFPIEYQAIERI